MANRQKEARSFASIDYFAFIIPSLVGILLFMVPLKINGDVTLTVAFLADLVQMLLGEQLPTIVTILLVLSALLSLVGSIARPSIFTRCEFWSALFVLTPFWLILRLVGVFFCCRYVT